MTDRPVDGRGTAPAAGLPDGIPDDGTVPVPAVERERVAVFHARLSGVPYAANRAVALLSRLYRAAATWGMVPDGTNPCRGIGRHRERRRERFLTDTEFRRLGTVLDRAVADGGVSGHAVAAIRLLLLTGCRKSEILSLKWQGVDLAAGEIQLADSKTGPRAVPLSPPAVRVLEELPRLPDSPWVIPGQKPGTHMTNLDGPWRIVRKRAGLDDVPIHDCRHYSRIRLIPGQVIDSPVNPVQFMGLCLGFVLTSWNSTWGRSGHVHSGVAGIRRGKS